MNAKKSSVLRGLLNLHKDEEGMEAIQVVAIVAIGALVLIFLKTTLWPKVQSWSSDQMSRLTQ
jgi:hypothetical protein